MKEYKIIIMGPQGSGKGTQARILAKKLGIEHISIGEVLRHEAERGSPIGKEIKKYMDKGELVPPEINDKVVDTILQNKKNFILDGYPRTEQQAKHLDEKTNITKAILIEISDKTAIERISGRRVCPVCGREYHIKYAPPKIEGKCDDDGAELEQREDDTPEAIKKRLEIYHEETEPLTHHYKEKLIIINGEQPIEKVAKDIEEKLNS